MFLSNKKEKSTSVVIKEKNIEGHEIILNIDSKDYYAGDEVFLFSSISGEEFQGNLKSISDEEVIVVTRDGIKLRIFLTSITTGRIAFSKQTSLS